MTSDNPKPEGQPGLAEVALLGLCPKCGARSLFAGAAKFADRCPACGLDFSKFNVGDGPAAFLTLIIGAIIVILAMWVEFTFYPPLWVHALLWIPFTAVSVLLGLRAAKAALLQSEYVRKAREATGADVDTSED